MTGAIVGAGKMHMRFVVDRSVLTACAAICAATGVATAGIPAAAAQDTRLVTRAYHEAEVVRIDGKLGVQATIGFGENELIENVAVGDAEKWQITPNKRADLLFVKPLNANARTNMTVVTNKRTYFFDLVASPAASPIYMLRFTYGAAQPAGAAPATARQSDPAMLNFAWRGKGIEKIGPARIYDDGSATYLLWPAGQKIPAIMVRDASGAERTAEYAIRGNAIVLPVVPREIVLRADRSTLTLENLNQQPPGPAPLAVSKPAVADAAAPTAAGAQAN